MYLAASTKFHLFLLYLPTTYTSETRAAPSFIYLLIQKSSISSSYPHPSLVKLAPTCVCFQATITQEMYISITVFLLMQIKAFVSLQCLLFSLKTPCIKTTVLDKNVIFFLPKREKF